MTYTEKLEAAIEAFRAVVEFMGERAHCSINLTSGEIRILVHLQNEEMES